MITIIHFNIQEDRPDLFLLREFEKFCVEESGWNNVKGPTLFKPLKISSRFYTLAHEILKPILKLKKIDGAVLSLGFPAKNLLYGKTFPYFAYRSDMRVVWCYDVWQNQYNHLEKLIQQADINLLLLSSYQATQHFKSIDTGKCVVEWVTETINPATYKYKNWQQKNIDVLAFGRVYSKYHDLIRDGLQQKDIKYSFQKKTNDVDVTRVGLKRELLQFPTQESFINGLSESKICICFPRSITHPDLAGEVSTITLRYLEAMASKCLILGSAPLDAKHLFDYEPFIEVDWKDPVGQIEYILDNYEEFVPLVEKNYAAVCSQFSYPNAIRHITAFIEREALK